MPNPPSRQSISPEEYLEHARRVSLGEPSPLDGQKLLVAGDVNLFRHPDQSRIKVLPPAEIGGDLRAQNCKELGVVRCTVLGSANMNASGVYQFSPDPDGRNILCSGVLNMANCESLTELSGHCGSDANLSGTSITSLGRDFSCEGNLHVEKCRDLVSVNCRAGGNLLAEYSGLERLGPDFECHGDWKLWYCYELQELGPTASTPSDVFLSNSSVRKIEPGFKCSGALVLRDVDRLEEISGQADSADIEAAPRLRQIKDLRVSGDLSVGYCPALEFVDFLAGATAKFDRCSMETICERSSAKELIVRECGKFKELTGLRWHEVALIDLPQLKNITSHFRCSQSLLLRGCPDLAVLEGRVGQNLTLNMMSGLRRLGDNLTVGENLILACPSLELESISCRVVGNLMAMGCEAQLSTGEGLRVEGNAIFDACLGLRDLRGSVGGNVSIRNGCGVENIGADFECGGDLVLDGCLSMRTINCRVSGDTVVKKSHLEKTGPAFHCQGSLHLDSVSGVKMLLGKVGGDCRFDFGQMIKSGVSIQLTRDDENPCQANTPVSPVRPLSRSQPSPSGQKPDSPSRRV